MQSVTNPPETMSIPKDAPAAKMIIKVRAIVLRMRGRSMVADSIADSRRPQDLTGKWSCSSKVFASIKDGRKAATFYCGTVF
jgi:hypothetical protein